VRSLDLATPIGHALAGYSVYLVSRSAFDARQRGKYGLVSLSIFMGVAPDLDFLPGLLLGTPAVYHQGISHSLGAALFIGLAIATFSQLTGETFYRIFRLCFLSYISHLVIDFFGPDGRLPYGVPLLWPLTNEHFLSPVPLFLGMHHAGSSHGSTVDWFKGIISLHNVWAILVEVLYMMPFVMLGNSYTRRHGE
jgi:inner membrane protein